MSEEVPCSPSSINAVTMQSESKQRIDECSTPSYLSTEYNSRDFRSAFFQQFFKQLPCPILLDELSMVLAMRGQILAGGTRGGRRLEREYVGRMEMDIVRGCLSHVVLLCVYA